MSFERNDSPKGEIRLIGRQRELERLLEAIEAAGRGATRAVWISGEAGIGKTRLLREAARYAAWRGWDVRFEGRRERREAASQAHRVGELERGLRVLDDIEDGSLLVDYEPRRFTCVLAAGQQASPPPGWTSVPWRQVSLGPLSESEALELVRLARGGSQDAISAADRESIRNFGGHPARLMRWVERRRDHYPSKPTLCDDSGGA